MKITDILLLDVAVIIMPVMIYLLYIAYVKTINEKENKLIFFITILSQIYLIYKYGMKINPIPPLIIDIPFLLSYNKKNLKIITIPSSIIYYYMFYKKYIIIIIIEYIIYYLVSIKIKKQKKFISIFILLKTIFITLYCKTINPQIIINSLFFYILSIFTIYLLEKTIDMLKLHKSIKEIENDKQIKTSLFKVTHEVKNPIAVCKGYLDMYDENKINDFKNKIPILKEEINRTLILLEDFLSMNSLKINKDILDINLLLEEVLKNIEMLINKNNIKLKSIISQDEIYINGDYNRLMQVLINILKNSIEALKNKKNPKIDVWSKKDSNNIHIYIKDNGEGITKETIKKIKTPFFTTKEKGTGLGVSLSNEIIKAHKGELNYESEEGKYTLVTITLPLEKAI